MTPNFLVVFALAAVTTPLSAQNHEIGYPDGSLAYEALKSSDYVRASEQLRLDHRVHFNDPARLINLGLAMAGTGQLKDARRAFDLALSEEEVELIMADGRVMGSHDAAREGLAMIKSMRTLARR